MKLKTKIMKTNKIIYWATTGILCALLFMSAAMYVFKHDDIVLVFKGLGYPAYLIYPLAFLKLAAVVVLLTQKNNLIKQWAYAGLFFDFVLAFFAHIMIGDGEHLGAVFAMVLLVVSYIFSQKIYTTNQI